ncbi:MAG: YdeI/OmpD-associated family protein [Gemmatimonadaceae bacterium]
MRRSRTDALVSKMPRKKTSAPDLPILPFATSGTFQGWLAEHHATSRGLWIKVAKTASGIASITYPEAVEVALCWGWIDGQARRIDETWYVQKFTPRGARSLWSRINCAKATALIAAGKMQPAGLAEVERAKHDGRWARAYDSPSKATIPDDLAAALARNTRASAFFAGLDSRNRYAILHRVQTAKKPETRARRIAEFVKMLARREKLYS